MSEGPADGRRTNVIAEWQTGKPKLGLYFYVDTVPVAPGWERDLFTLTREENRLYGLGAADMKGSIAAVLLALKVAHDTGVPLAYDLVLLLCTDEEGGLYPGARYLGDTGRMLTHVLNFNGSTPPRIWAGCFGLFNLLVRVKGHAVHMGEGNRTGAGVNAIEMGLPLLSGLQELKAKVGKRTSAMPAPPPMRRGRCGRSSPSRAPMAGPAAGRCRRASMFSSIVVMRPRRASRAR